MNNQIIKTLKRKISELTDEYGNISTETQRNVVKEELHYYILNFVYHHPEYVNWTMYGGSSLRICHKLDRMSVDLDFEITHPISEECLEKLKKEIESYFLNNYNTGPEILTIKRVGNRGLRLNFCVNNELGIQHSSNYIHVKVDLNYFIAPNTVIESIGISCDQFSFPIKIYNMSSLMASKIAAILLRGQRGIGNVIYQEKGRDIYDLLWYMGKRIIPDLDYLIAKKVDIKDLRTLFDKLTLQMNKVSDENLRQDLSPLFLDQEYIENWIKNWRENYLRLLKEYNIFTITKIEEVNIHQDFNTEIYFFSYLYQTEDMELIKITYRLSDYWISYSEGDLSIPINWKIDNIIKFGSNIGDNSVLQEKLKQYATLFSQKNESYFKKMNNVMISDTITTKLIRMTSNNLNNREHILLNKSALISCKLDDLFK